MEKLDHKVVENYVVIIVWRFNKDDRCGLNDSPGKAYCLCSVLADVDKFSMLSLVML